jgi:hypothetical protein
LRGNHWLKCNPIGYSAPSAKRCSTHFSSILHGASLRSIKRIVVLRSTPVVAKMATPTNTWAVS